MVPDVSVNSGRVISRRRRFLFGCILLAFLLALTIAACEVVVRVYLWSRGWTPNCYAASLDMFQPHAQRGYDLKPNFRLQSGVFKTSTNSIGLRGPEVAVAPAGDTIRIAMAGGSSAFGYLVNDGQEAARVLEEELRGKGIPVEVINAAVPGYNLFQSRGRFQDRISQLEPDYLILYQGYNDLAYICSDDPGRERFRLLSVAPPLERLLGKSALYGLLKYRLLSPPMTVRPAYRPEVNRTEAGCEQFRQNLRAMADAARAAGAKLIVCSQCMAAHPEAPDEIKRLAARDPAQIEPTIESSGWVRDTLELFAQRHNLPFVNAYGELPPTPQNLGDDIHLTVQGERLLGELLAERILPLLDPAEAELSLTPLPQAYPSPSD